MSTVIANEDMAKAWDGEEGDRWTEYADRYDMAGARFWQRFLDAGLVSAADRVLDIGCGAGQSTIDAAKVATAGSALGVDLSSRMLDLGRQRSRAQGLTNVEFLQADAQVHRFEERAYDVAISRFGAMFFNDRAAAFDNIGRAVRSGGQLALLAWRELAHNEWVSAFIGALAAGREIPGPPTGAPGPFGLADPDEVRSVLGVAGFSDVDLTEVTEAMRFGSDAQDAWSFVRSTGVVKGLSEGLDEHTRAAAHETLRDVLAAHESADGVQFAGSAWLITARRP